MIFNKNYPAFFLYQIIMKNFYLLLMLFTATLFSAQWNTNVLENMPVSPVKAEVNYTATTSDGKTYVVFWEKGDGFYYRLRVQLLTSTGEKLFGEEGMLVNDTAVMSSFIQTMDIALDSQDNLYLTFVGTSNGIGYVNKISPSGENLWGSQGVQIETNSVTQVKLLNLDSNVVVAYIKTGKGYLKGFEGESGNELWAEPIFLNSPQTGLNYTSVSEMGAFADGSFIVTYIARDLAYNMRGAVFAQRFLADGSPVWSEPLKVTSVAGATFNRRYNVFADADNFYIGFTLYVSTLGKNVYYTQKIGKDGTLPWGLDGKKFSTEVYDQSEIRLVEKDNKIWALGNYKNTTLAGIYLQQYDKESGEATYDTPKMIYNVTGDKTLLNVTDLKVFASGHLGFVTQNKISPSVALIYTLVILDEEGDIYHEFEMTAETKKTWPTLSVFNQQAILVWQDGRDATKSQIYAQNYILDTESLQTSNSPIGLFQVYPNPVISEINIKTNENIKTSAVYDLSGKMVLTSKVKTIDVRTLKPGVYILKTTFENGKSATSKLIKK